MAFVGISRDFKDRVERKINNMRNAELKTLGDQPKVTLSPNTPFILNLVWGEHLHLKAQIPENWKGREESVALKYLFEHESEKYAYAFDVSLTDKLETPPSFYRYSHMEVAKGIPELATIETYYTSYHEITLRWQTVKSKIINFLDSCKSANEAVKLWPDVKMYFDADDIDRLERKVERAGSPQSQAAQVLSSMDLGELQSAAVIARLSGAKV